MTMGNRGFLWGALSGSSKYTLDHSFIQHVLSTHKPPGPQLAIGRKSPPGRGGAGQPLLCVAYGNSPKGGADPPTELVQMYVSILRSSHVLALGKG